MGSGEITYQDVWVVFTDKTDISFLRHLKPGYRHCYALVKSESKKWVKIDPTSKQTKVYVFDFLSEDFDLSEWFSQNGHTIVKAPRGGDQKNSMFIGVISCVEITKKIAGIGKANLFTPYQLYTWLKSQEAT